MRQCKGSLAAVALPGDGLLNFPPVNFPIGIGVNFIKGSPEPVRGLAPADFSVAIPVGPHGHVDEPLSQSPVVPGCPRGGVLAGMAFQRGVEDTQVAVFRRLHQQGHAPHLIGGLEAPAHPARWAGWIIRIVRGIVPDHGRIQPGSLGQCNKVGVTVLLLPGEIPVTDRQQFPGPATREGGGHLQLPAEVMGMGTDPECLNINGDFK